MKRFWIGAVMAVGLACVTACSSEEPEAENGSKNDFGGAVAYVMDFLAADAPGSPEPAVNKGGRVVVIVPAEGGEYSYSLGEKACCRVYLDEEEVFGLSGFDFTCRGLSTHAVADGAMLPWDYGDEWTDSMGPDNEGLLASVGNPEGVKDVETAFVRYEAGARGFTVRVSPNMSGERRVHRVFLYDRGVVQDCPLEVEFCVMQAHN